MAEPKPRETQEDLIKRIVGDLFKERDRQAQAQKDPWVRLEETIKKVVNETLDQRLGGDEDEDDQERGGDKGILGGIFGA